MLMRVVPFDLLLSESDINTLTFTNKREVVVTMKVGTVKVIMRMKGGI